MAATDPKYVLRYPEELRQRVAASAKANNRSINAEVCFQLQRAYENELGLAKAGLIFPIARADEIMSRMDSMAGNS